MGFFERFFSMYLASSLSMVDIAEEYQRHWSFLKQIFDWKKLQRNVPHDTVPCQNFQHHQRADSNWQTELMCR